MIREARRQMNRDEIDIVTSSWLRATSDPDRLQAAVVGRLPGSMPFRDVRAQWIVDAVTRLAPALDHPATFVPLAGDLLAARMPVTMDELALERDALFGALGDVGEPIEPTRSTPGVGDGDRALRRDRVVGVPGSVRDARGMRRQRPDHPARNGRPGVRRRRVKLASVTGHVGTLVSSAQAPTGRTTTEQGARHGDPHRRDRPRHLPPVDPRARRGPAGGFAFNQFLVRGDEPFLFHTGMRAVVPAGVATAIGRVLGRVEKLRWISFAHVEADECGAMNQFLAAAPGPRWSTGRWRAWCR